MVNKGKSMKDPQEPCRLCMGRSNGIEIFSKGAESSDLANKISYSVGIKAKASDTRLTLCVECHDKVQTFFDFKLMCQKTEKEIGSTYSSPSKQLISEVQIKKEPGTEQQDKSSKISPLVPYAPPIPGESWPRNGMVFYATVNEKGQAVPVHAMVPYGEPIPLPLGVPVGAGMPMTMMPVLPPVLPVLPPVSTSSQIPPIKPKAEPLSDDDGHCAVKPTPLEEVEPVSSSGATTEHTGCDSDDMDLKDILSQVHTDEDEGKDSASEIAASNTLSRASRKTKKKARAGPKCSKQNAEEEEKTDDKLESGRDTPENFKSAKRPRDKSSDSRSSRLRRRTRDSTFSSDPETETTLPPPIEPSSRPRRSCVTQKKKKIYESDSSDEEPFMDDSSGSRYSDKKDGSSSSDSDPDNPDTDESDTGNKSDVVQKSSKPAPVPQTSIKPGPVPQTLSKPGPVPQTLSKPAPGPVTVNKPESETVNSNADDSKPKFKFTQQLQCKFCPRTFRSEQYLKCHEETHRTIKRFTCMKCEKTFTSRSDLEHHEESNHLNETWECRPCFVAFAQIKTWRSHVKRHKAYPRETVIELTGDGIRSEGSENLSGTDQNQASSSEKATSTKKTEKKATETRVSVVKPMPAVKPSRRKNSTDTEEEDVDDPDALETLEKKRCVECSATFKNEASLTEHMKVHQKSKYVCKYCDRQFKDKGALICHETEHKPKSQPKSIKCRFCDDVFSSLSDKICHEEINHRK